jgi:membrane protein implicated in regulation of membrane protease activity
VSLVIALLIAYFFLDWPWSLLVLIPAAALEAFEIWLYFRWRKVSAISGSETMIGARGKTVGACDPKGQASIRGQLWTVECDEPLERGVEVEVVALEGLTLKVRRTTP